MSEFELLVVPLSLILGLGMTRMLSSFIHILRLREGASLHWMPVAWSIVILGYIVQYFNYLFDIGVSDDPWNWKQYGPSLIQSMLLFASAGLIFPGESSLEPPDMAADFREHGRLALIPLAVFLVQAVPANTLIGGVPWLSASNILCISGAALLCTTYVTKNGALRTMSTVAFAAVSVIGWVVVWAQPGSS